MKTLSNFELIELAKQYNIPLSGVYNRDSIPNHLPNGYYILNLDRQSGAGTHWVAIYKSNKMNFYFDSFGFDAPIQVSQALGKYFYNKKIIQSINSNSCGWWALWFIKYTSEHNNNPFEFISLLVDNKPELNERKLEDYWSKSH